MDGKTVLITGASAGIGLHTAIGLATLGADVVMVGRDERRTAEAASLVKTQTGNPSVSYLIADLSSLHEVRKLASEFKSKHKKLDVLVNNAGALFLWRKTTVDGYEMTFALNHLNYFLLTELLLEVLQAQPKARIVNVSSSAHYRGYINFDDLHSAKFYNGLQVYSNSKLANVLFTYELARRLKGSNVTANCLHPGFVASNFALNNGFLVNIYMAFMWHRLTNEQGARTSIHLASSPDIENVSGKFFNYTTKEKRSSGESYNESVAKRLWDVSEKLVTV